MMSNTKPALINYTLETFANERDMHWHLSQWEKRKAEYYPKLKAAGLKKMTGTKVWNNKGRPLWAGYLSMRTLNLSKNVRKYLERSRAKRPKRFR